MPMRMIIIIMLLNVLSSEIRPACIMATLQSQSHRLKQTVHSYSDSAQPNNNGFTRYNSDVGLRSQQLSSGQMQLSVGRTLQIKSKLV